MDPLLPRCVVTPPLQASTSSPRTGRTGSTQCSRPGRRSSAFVWPWGRGSGLPFSGASAPSRGDGAPPSHTHRCLRGRQEACIPGGIMLAAPGLWTVLNKCLLDESVFPFHNVSGKHGSQRCSGEARPRSPWEANRKLAPKGSCLTAVGPLLLLVLLILVPGVSPGHRDPPGSGVPAAVTSAQLPGAPAPHL